MDNGTSYVTRTEHKLVVPNDNCGANSSPCETIGLLLGYTVFHQQLMTFD